MKPRAMYSRISIEADLDSLAKSQQATTVVLRALRDRLTPEEGRHAVALKEQLSAGEVDDIAAQLPTDLKGVWGQA